MANVRFHLVLNDSLDRAVRFLGKKWGLDRTNTIRHCIALAQEVEKATERLQEPKPLLKYRRQGPEL